VTARTLSPEEVAQRAAGTIPLSDLASGESGIVSEFRAGRMLQSRCLPLGFTPGAEVKMVQNVHAGPVIVLVRDTRVALGRREAQKILVHRKVEAHAPQQRAKHS